jgi:hypothetical protein
VLHGLVNINWFLAVLRRLKARCFAELLCYWGFSNYFLIFPLYNFRKIKKVGSSINNCITNTIVNGFCSVNTTAKLIKVTGKVSSQIKKNRSLKALLSILNRATVPNKTYKKADKKIYLLNRIKL